MYSALRLKQLVPDAAAGFVEQRGKHWTPGTARVAGLLPGTTEPGLLIWSSSVSPGLRLPVMEPRLSEQFVSKQVGRAA